MPKHLLQAAQYLRMSRDEQVCSLSMQRQAISRYAQEKGYEVCKSYEDAGKSGLGLKGRKALKRLLNDVLSNSCSFKAILVYDVSRWGRFQDCDESAHYEFLCRHAGVPVHYCAEPFTNDLTTQSSILKTLKRIMAAEYSREQSKRGYAAKRRSASSGFRQGGPAGFGLRRATLSADGKSSRVLTAGQRKPFRTDRVILIPGPKEEVTHVRQIFSTYLQGRGKVKPGEIARKLNREHVPAENGKLWTTNSVLGILTNPKYVGRLVWGQTTQKLQTSVRCTPKSDWVIYERAFEQIIDPHTFEKVQALLRHHKGRRIQDAELIRAVKRVFAKHGRVSETLMGAKNNTYSLCAIYRRFGSCRAIYDSVGFKYGRELFHRGRETIRIRNEVLREIILSSDCRVSPFRLPHAGTRANLVIDEKYRMYVWIALRDKTMPEEGRWVLRPVHRENDEPVLLCIMDVTNRDCEALYLLPPTHLDCILYKFGRDDVFLRDGIRLNGWFDIYAAIRNVHWSGRSQLLR